METNRVLWVAAALAPALALLVFIWITDRRKKESWWLLLLLFGLGAAICLPINYAEMGIFHLIDVVFGVVGKSEFYKSYVMESGRYFMFQAARSVLGYALVEETFKWIVLVAVTRKSRHFNSLFDGVVCAVFVSLGFAAIENVRYVFGLGGLDVAASRSYTAIPGHFSFAVIMGAAYSLWHVREKALLLERSLEKEGLIPCARRYKTGLSAALSLALPVIFHGFYDICCDVSEPFFRTLFYIQLVALYVCAIGFVFVMRKKDVPDTTAAMRFVARRRPEIREALRAGTDETAEAPADIALPELRHWSGGYTGTDTVLFREGRYAGDFLNGLAEGEGAFYPKTGGAVRGPWKAGAAEETARLAASEAGSEKTEEKTENGSAGENGLLIESADPYAEDMGDWIDREFDAFAERHGVTCGYAPFAFAAKKNGAVVGVVKGHSYYREVHVGELIVAEGYRGQGIGMRLLAAAEAFFKGKGLDHISLTTYRFQAPEFYRKNGYTLEFIREDTACSALDKYFFIKKLD